MAIPRSYNKSWIGRQANLCPEITSQEIQEYMPDASGYHSIWQMRYINRQSSFITDAEAAIYSLNVIPKINHLSKDNKEYVLSNLIEFTKVYEYLVRVNIQNPHHNNVNQALSRTITHNLIRKKLNKPHILPNRLSRKYDPVVAWINTLPISSMPPDAVDTPDAVA